MLVQPAVRYPKTSNVSSPSRTARIEQVAIGSAFVGRGDETGLSAICGLTHQREVPDHVELGDHEAKQVASFCLFEKVRPSEEIEPQFTLSQTTRRESVI